MWVGVFGLAVGPSGSTSAGLGLCQRRWPVQLPGCAALSCGKHGACLLAGSHDANEGSPGPGGGEPLSCSCLCWRVLRERQGALHRPKYTRLAAITHIDGTQSSGVWTEVGEEEKQTGPGESLHFPGSGLEKHPKINTEKHCSLLSPLFFFFLSFPGYTFAVLKIIPYHQQQ